MLKGGLQLQMCFSDAAAPDDEDEEEGDEDVEARLLPQSVISASCWGETHALSFKQFLEDEDDEDGAECGGEDGGVLED